MPVVSAHVAAHRAPARRSSPRRSSPRLERAGKVASVVLLAAVVALGVVLIVVPKATGSVPLTVLTGSMSPAYEPGSVVVVRPTPVDDLKIGDVITFQKESGDPTVVTHRIVSLGVTGDGSRQFVTQGDANNTPDAAPVSKPQVRGKVWYSVPYVGYAVNAVDAEQRATLVKVLAAALLLYGGYLIAAGGREQLRNRARRAEQAQQSHEDQPADRPAEQVLS